MEGTPTRGRTTPVGPRPGAGHDLSAIHGSVNGSRSPSLRKAPPERSLSSWPTQRSARFRQVLGDKVPVHQVVEESLDEIRAAVLEVEVISVLPHIAGKERGLAFCQRVD